jgi:o-succinylbenzoate synthase
LSLFLNHHATTEIAVNGITGIHMPGDGFKVIKVKVGFRGPLDETQQMVMLTKSFGEDIMFRLDANGSFNLTQAICFCKEMEAFNIDYIEQPLPADNFEELAELRHNTDIPIALDESLTDLSSAEKIIEKQAADIFVIKPMVSGGFTECKKIIDLAKTENIRSIVTTSLETKIGRTACLHLAAANELSEPCGLSTAALLHEDATGPVIENGRIRIPDIPGMGMGI